jgi:adenosylhomocysteine nucleosidase
MASVLVVTPQSDEAEALLRGIGQQGLHSESRAIGTLTCALVPALDMLIAVGGNGKAQFGVQAQHLIDHCPGAQVLFCVGAAGCLSDGLSVGDVVVGTSTIEHDYKERFIPEPLPCHEGDAEVLRQFVRVVRRREFPFRVHFGPIASGDEDIVDAARAAELQGATHALCVAWEGSGGARAARFSGLRFVEVRVVTDAADARAAQSFHADLGKVVPNAAVLLVAWYSEMRGAATRFAAANNHLKVPPLIR